MEKRRRNFWISYLDGFAIELGNKLKQAPFGIDNTRDVLDKIINTVIANLDDILSPVLPIYIANLKSTSDINASIYEGLFNNDYPEVLRVLQEFCPKVFQDINLSILKFKYNIFCCLERTYKHWREVSSNFDIAPAG